MTSINPAPEVSKSRVWLGRALSAGPVLMLVSSAVMKLVHPPELDPGFAQLGWPVGKALGLGILELACTAIYVIPRTSVLGAILLSGYLGGATATHVRIDDSYLIAPLLIALIWGGLYLRDPRLHALLPFVSNARP